MAVSIKQLNAFEAAIARNISAGTILAQYDICFRVENAVDIRFWQSLLAPNIRDKKVKFFPFVQQGNKRITGKSYIMKHQFQANASYILCVDSDLDYILGKKDFDAEHFILQTYTYSWENHFCWRQSLQTVWLPWQKSIDFDFTAFLSYLSATIFDAFVVMLTKKRFKHRGFTLDMLCNTIDSVQGNQKEALLDNGKGICEKVRENIKKRLANVEKESKEDLQKEVKHLKELGITNSNVYLYMQGHAIYDLICRIGKVLMDESFEHQVLAQSFSPDNDYRELAELKYDIHHVICNN